jgi:hypothetical protein
MFQIDKAWFEEADWPLTSKEEISHHHLEALRKMLFIWKYPDAGRNLRIYEPIESSGLWSVGTPYYKGGVTRRGSLVVVHFGELWTNSVEWEDTNIPEPPREFHRYVRVTNSGNVYKCKVIHKATRTFADELTDGLWELDTVPNGVVSGTAYYSPAAWTLGTEYFTNEWITSGSGWILTADTNRYHDFDARQTRWCYDSTHNAWIDYEVDFNMNLLLPIQTDEVSRNAPFYFENIAKYHYVHKDKVSLAASIITVPNMMGAQWSEGVTDNHVVDGGNAYTRSSAFVDYPLGGNQYSNGANYPKADGFEGNPKVASGSYQQIAEVYCNNTKWAVNSAYTTNFNLYDTTHNAGANQWGSNDYAYYPTYDSTCSQYFGCNESSFEFLKQQQDLFDWYWDAEYPYIPFGLRVIKTAHVASGYNDANFPEPVGTWRRTWKYSMGRPSSSGVPKFMRAAEKGAPTQGNYPGDMSFDCLQPDGTDAYNVKFIFPLGTFVSTIPVISDFTNWSYSIVDVTDGNLIEISGDHAANLHVGALVYLGSGTAIAGYPDSANVVTVEVIDGSTFVRLNIDVATIWTAASETLTVCGDERLSARHDPVQMDGISGITPTYEITADLLNELREFIGYYQWFEYTADWQARNIRSHAGTLSVSASYSIISAALSAASAFPKDPESWYDPDNPDYDANGGWLTQSKPALGVYEGASLWRSADSGFSVPGVSDACYFIKSAYYPSGIWCGDMVYGNTCRMLVASAISADDGDELIKNASAVIIRIAYSDTAEDDFSESTQEGLTLYPLSVLGQSAGGITAGVVAYGEETPTKHKDFTLPTNGRWIKFFPGVMPSMSLLSHAESPYYLDYGYIEQDYYRSTAIFGSLSLSTSPVIVKLSYNNIPKDVFKRYLDTATLLGQRDNFGFIIWPTNLFGDDTQAPLPLEGAAWCKEPYTTFEYTEVFHDHADYDNASTVSSISSSVLTYTNTNDAGDRLDFSEGDIVELIPSDPETCVAPTGTSYYTPYIILSINVGTGKLYIVTDSIQTQVTITSSGTGTHYLRQAACYKLFINSEIQVSEDLEQNDPVLYRMVGIDGDAWTTTYGEDNVFKIFENLYSVPEIEDAGGIGIDDCDITLATDYFHTFSCILDPTGYIQTGDYVSLTEDIVSPVYGNSYLVTDVTATTVTINALTLATTLSSFDSSINRLYLTGESGYVLPQYLQESASAYTFKPQTEDSAVVKNEGKLGKLSPVPEVVEYPYELGGS